MQSLCVLLYLFLICLSTQLLHSQSSNTNADEIFLPFPIEPTTSESTLEVSPNPKTKFNEGFDPLNNSSSDSEDKKSNSRSVPESQEVKEQGLDKKLDSMNSKLSDKADTAKPTKKKKGKADAVDPTEPPFKRGKALLTRNQKKSAESEFADSYSKEGTKANPSRTENANLFGLDAKNAEGTGLVEKIEDPDAKIKAQFELARSLDRMGVSDSEEKAYKEYLKLVTSFPVHPEITPRTHLAIAVLLFRRQEYRPALHHLIKVMKEFKDSKQFPSAHYYAGRIYESVWADRDLERAKKYYDLYLKEVETREETPGNDFKKDAMERRRLIESPLGV
jgi:tetratricopeptide (TPR) repeat protein